MGCNFRIVLALGLFVAGRAVAQTPPDPPPGPPAAPESGGGAVTARDLANAANNPTSPTTLLQFRDAIVPDLPGFTGAGNIFQLQPVLPILPSKAIPFTQLMKITLPFPSLPSPVSQAGVGDLQVFDLVTISQSWGRWGFGPALVFPTASSPVLGNGKWQAGPSFALIYTGVKHLVAGAVLQNPISYAGSPNRPDVNNLIVTPSLTYNLPEGWFAGYSDFNWVFNWKDHGAATFPVGLQVGKVFTIGKQPLSFSIEGGYYAARPSSSFPRWTIGIELTPIFGAL